MTLLDAKEFDLEKERKRKKRIISAIVVVVILLCLGWWFRYWPEEHIAGRFFDSLQKQDYKTAYGIWMHDAQWQQHPEQHGKYPFNEFYRDWGPGGEWGIIKTQKVYGASTCPGGGTGVVVDVVVNDRAQHAQVWVEKSDKTLSFPPCELIFR
ncbi:MAG TPA: hypothetical protein VFE61_08900 [Candidatus Sulfotelmatobacter sp.]|jgi:hypothetical protein|nr:hypothetical protein [Candidatus Sulfotelmatobacter sp.]